MECIEVSHPDIIPKPHGHIAAMARLASVALLALMLWLGVMGSVNAQSVPPTSPCPQGGVQIAPGWTPILTPDCSGPTAWLSTAGSVLPWSLGNVPATPGGHTTFATISSDLGGEEGMTTTMTGLQAGRTYNVSIFTNGNYPTFYAKTCSLTITLNGVSATHPATPGNNWTQRQFPFVATGPTASFRIQVQKPSSGYCVSNIYVAANAVVPAVVDADVQMTKAVLPTGTVASGSVLTYTLVARNNGPAPTTNVLLRDTPGAGLNCTTPSPTATCSASGGASCPGATVPVSSLTGGGVSIPSLPVGGQVVVTMQCTVTATGR